MLWLLLLACQEPFGADRHDLVGHRIAAVEVEVGADAVRPRAALIDGGRTWSDAPPTLGWWWLPDADALDALDAGSTPDARGATPTLGPVPPAAPVLALVATWSDGDQRRAFVDLTGAPRAGARPTALVARALPLEVPPEGDEEAGEALELEARRRLAATDGPLAPGGFARLVAEGVPTADTVRWMATAGTFLELDPVTTDWVAGDLVLDDETVEAFTPAPAGTLTFLALALGDGLGRFRAADVHVGVDPVGAWVDGRWLPGDDGALPGWVVLVAADDAPLGLAVGARAQGPDTPPPCGVDTGGRLVPDALLTGACGRSDLAGATVWLEADP